MTFAFHPDLPPHATGATLVVSGEESLRFNHSEYLIVSHGVSTIFEIKYERHYSPFKQADVLNGLLLIGHEEYFYLYDLVTQQNLIALKMEGYFGHFYIHEDEIFVADAGSLFCLHTSGEVSWVNKNLGVDGVLVDTFTERLIYGSGEWDPPGGWRDFVLEYKYRRLLIITPSSVYF